jgi:hypothetical protein
MNIGFAAVETYFPAQNYKEWSKLYQIKEFVSICSFCPAVIEITSWVSPYLSYLDPYWVYNDLDHLLYKVQKINKNDFQILAVVKEPDTECTYYFEDSRFKFYGYDLIDTTGNISALTNCGGFDKAFSTDDISIYGLIEDFNKVQEVQKELIEKYPEEPHAKCFLWAIWRMDEK